MMTLQSFPAPLVPPQHLRQFLDIQSLEKNKPSIIMPWLSNLQLHSQLSFAPMGCNLPGVNFWAQPSSWGKFTACQGRSSPQHPARMKKGGKDHFFVDVTTFLTLPSYSFDCNRAINPAVLCLLFQESLLQYFGEPVTISDASQIPGLWLLPTIPPSPCEPGSLGKIQINNRAWLCWA